MKSIVFAAVAAASVCCHANANPKDERSPDEKMRIRMENRNKYMMKKCGGFLLHPNSGKGAIGIYNNQKLVPAETFERVAKMIGASYHFNVAVTNVADAGFTPAQALKCGPEIAIIVWDAKGEPGLLIAPEDRWAKINVRKLAWDGADAEVLAKRARLELMRAIVGVCGGSDSQLPGTYLDYLPDPAMLDKVPCELIPPDKTAGMTKFLRKVGVVPWRYTTYQKACQEGWAPAPTNEFQKVIWDQVHALPTEPIRILPESQKK